MKSCEIAGLILAGGRGTRMDQADKGLVELAGCPMVEHVAGRFAPQVGALLISANRNPDRYAAYGKVIADDPARGAWMGPLAGVAAGLCAAELPWLATVPCDAPFLPADLVRRLAQGLQGEMRNGSPARLAVAYAGGRRQTVCMLLARDLLTNLLAYLAAGERKVDAWQSRVGCVEVPFDDMPAAFLNVNTRDELASAAAQAAGRYTSQ